MNQLDVSLSIVVDVACMCHCCYSSKMGSPTTRLDAVEFVFFEWPFGDRQVPGWYEGKHRGEEQIRWVAAAALLAFRQ